MLGPRIFPPGAACVMPIKEPEAISATPPKAASLHREGEGDLPADVLEKLAIAVRIPDCNRSLFKMCIQATLPSAWRKTQSLPLSVLNRELPPDFVPDLIFGHSTLIGWGRLGEKERALFLRLERAATEFRDALQDCVFSDDHTTSYLNEALLRVHDELKAPGRPLSLRAHWDLMTPLIEVALVAGAAAKKMINKWGRPKSREALYEIVDSLRWATQQAGGHFTFTAANGGQGTLIDALEVLRPFLPKTVLPNALPISTLRRAVKLSKNRS
jgi:hypothetical protein